MILFTIIALGFWGILIGFGFLVAKTLRGLSNKQMPSPTDTED